MNMLNLIDRKTQPPPITGERGGYIWLLIYSPKAGGVGSHVDGHWDIAYWDGETLWVDCGTERGWDEDKEWTHWALLEKPLEKKSTDMYGPTGDQNDVIS